MPHRHTNRNYDTPWSLPAPSWSPPLGTTLHPDTLTRVSAALTEQIAADPTSVIGQAFATDWDPTAGVFKEVFKMYAVLKTETRGDVYCVTPEDQEEALADWIDHFVSRFTGGEVYVVPV